MNRLDFRTVSSWTIALVCAAALLACGDDDPDASPTPSADAGADEDGGGAGTDGGMEEDTDMAPSSLAEELGLTVYTGAITPTVDSEEGNVTTYAFDPAEGPVCMRGAQYRVGVRNAGSDDLVIFLQGGGACWSDFCLATTGAPAGVPTVDILDPEMELNPVADWNAVYLPYCDGSFFVGDAEYDDNLNDNGVRLHHGLANLTAALEVAAADFPSPNRILLAGSSGGAYGLAVAAPLTRHYFPDAELIVMADSGIGLGKDMDDTFINSVLEEFNVSRFIPDDCDECVQNGHISGMLGYFLENDHNSRMGMFISWYDSVLATTFLQVPPEQWVASVERESQALHDRFPERFRRFIVDGITHTALLGDASGIIGDDLSAVEAPPEVLSGLFSAGLDLGGLDVTTIDDLTMGAWLGSLVANDEGWVDIVQERGPAPDSE